MKKATYLSEKIKAVKFQATEKHFFCNYQFLYIFVVTNICEQSQENFIDNKEVAL